MTKRWTATLLTAAIIAAAAGSVVAAPAPQPSAEKTPPRFQNCLWPNPCGPSVGKKGGARKPQPLGPITIQIDPLSLKVLEMPDVTTAIRIKGKTVYVNPDGSIALPKAKIPKAKPSPTATPDEEAFKTVKMETAAAEQANEMSERTAGIKDGAADSKSGAEKAFGTGEAPKS